MIQAIDSGFAKRSGDHRRLQRHHADRGGRAVLARHRTGQGFCRHLRHRHPDDGLHRLHLTRCWCRSGCGARRPKEIAAGAGDASFRPARKSRSWASAAGRSRCRSSCRSRRWCCSSTVDMNYGIDFKGGSLIEVQGEERQRRSWRHPRAALRAQHRRGAGAGDRRAERRADTRRRAGWRRECRADGHHKMRGELQDDYEFRRVEVVGPTVSGELAKQGTIGMLVALAWHPGLCLVPLRMAVRRRRDRRDVHDIVMTFGFFVVTGLEFNQSSIAAILTIVGYSLNDTVVVYDRVREDLRQYKKMPLPHLLEQRHQRDAVAHDADRGDDNAGAAGAVAVRRRGDPFVHRWPCCSASSSAPIRRSSSPRRC